MKTLIILIFLIISCNKSDKEDSTKNQDLSPEYPKLITIAQIPTGAATKGIFDPSLEYDPIGEKIWMSYSAVYTSPSFSDTTHRVVSTRMAFSVNKGEDWTDYGIVNPITEGANGTYVNEVSSIVYDPRDSDNPWKLVWFKYFLEENHNPIYEYSWIGVKSASSPENLTSASEVRLFAGSLYADGANPLIQIGSLHADLNKCIALTEPGLASNSTGLYISLGCLYMDGVIKQDIILLKFTGNSTNITNLSNWNYVGTLLNSDDASDYGSYIRYSGSELVVNDNKYYLLATLGSNEPINSHYNGCVIFNIPDLDTPSLTYVNSLDVGLGRDDFYGACDYNSNLTNNGIFYIYPEWDFENPSNSMFYIYASGKSLD